MQHAARYFAELADVHASGAATGETSYYTPLGNLLNALGEKLKPKVLAVGQLKSAGAGHPDFGLFLRDRGRRAAAEADAESLWEKVPVPARGVVEVKAADDEVFKTAAGKQVTKYWDRYGLVLVTNYREFLLVGKRDGKAVELESLTIADDEAEFRRLCRAPEAFARDAGDRLEEYLRRVLLHEAPVAKAEDVAWFLAGHAREASRRIDAAPPDALDNLGRLRRTMEEALGVTFSDDDDEHFFRSTLVQTLFYGLFSAWVIHARARVGDDGEAGRFDWKDSDHLLRIPMLQGLFHQAANPSRLRPLGLYEPLDRAGDVLNRVDRAAFFAEFDDGDAVQYFYEPFLKAFDPALRKELGVWYTPREIVTYMVERVDRVLRDELKIADGLADENVYILDPCCGTGAYLVEVLRRIAATLEEKGDAALVGHDLRKAATTRVFGFEILPAPYVVAHLQVGLSLAKHGAPLGEGETADDRAQVFLTNALTGWDRPRGDARTPPFAEFPEFREEVEAAAAVKRSKPILVVLGNPPYNAFAGVSPDEEGDLVGVYKKNLNVPVKDGGWGIKKFNLDDLYVRFFRVAERCIAQGRAGRGVVCYISNSSYVGDPSFVVMRRSLLDSFDKIWVDNLNGDSRETGKKTPDGKPDPSVFSTPSSPVGIRTGTAVGLFVKLPEPPEEPEVRYREFWGAEKRANLLAAYSQHETWMRTSAIVRTRFSFRQSATSTDYADWPSLTEISSEAPITGLKENRHFSMIVDDRDLLTRRMSCYFDESVSWEVFIDQDHGGLAIDAAGYKAEVVRGDALGAEKFDVSNIYPYALRPFEMKWAYVPSTPSLWNRTRPALTKHHSGSGWSVISRRASEAAGSEGVPMLFTRVLADFHCVRGQSHHFPVRLNVLDSNESSLFQFEEGESYVENLSIPVADYLERLKVPFDAEAIWHHVLAIGYSPAYLTENADGLRDDWPRIPLPDAKDRFEASVDLGRRVAALLDTESAADGVTAGRLEPFAKLVAAPARVDATQIDPDAGHLDLTAGWGRRQKTGVFPGTGRTVARDFTPAERDALGDEACGLLGPDTLDVYLNDETYWGCVPRQVWEFRIGGYQVLKKWLSYREKAVLGRGLKVEELRHVTDTARRLAALVLMRPELDANYEAVKADAYDWPRD